MKKLAFFTSSAFAGVTGYHWSVKRNLLPPSLSNFCPFTYHKTKTPIQPLKSTRPEHIDYIVYHGGCPDGTVGAWVFQHNYPNAKLVPWRHGDALPKVSGSVVFIDISPNLAQLKKLSSRHNLQQLTILDHHKTAERELDQFHLPKEKGDVVFDMNKSGCRLAWDYLYKDDVPLPWWLLAVEAGDLWKQDSIENCEELLCALHNEQFLSSVEQVEALNQSTMTRQQFLDIGRVLLQCRQQQVTRCAQRSVPMTLTLPNPSNTNTSTNTNHNIGPNNNSHLSIQDHQLPINEPTTEQLVEQYSVRVVSSTSELRSHVGHEVAEGQKCDFAVVQNFDPSRDMFILSLRGSDQSDLDLGDIAKRAFGGGGHPKAAGARLHRDKWHEYFQAV